MQDQFGRSIEYLRISITDRCNFRCLYCMPVAGLDWLPKAEILAYEEIRDIVAQLAPLGLRRLRITGGEPTIRPGLSELIAMLHSFAYASSTATFVASTAAGEPSTAATRCFTRTRPSHA